MPTDDKADPRAYDKLVTYYGDGYFKIIHPIELKHLEQDQEALKVLVRYYASLQADHA